MAQHLQYYGLSEMIHFYARELHGVPPETDMSDTPITELVVAYALSRLDRAVERAYVDAKASIAAAERAEARLADLEECRTRAELLLKVLLETLGGSDPTASAGSRKRPRLE